MSNYLLIKVNKLSYGIDIMNIDEIIPYEEPTKLPNTPEHMAGVLVHRNTTIPILHTAILLGINNAFSSQEFKSTTRIVIVKLEDNKFGLVVEEASSILDIEDEQIESIHSIRGINKSHLIKGIAKIDETNLVPILNINNIMESNTGVTEEK